MSEQLYRRIEGKRVRYEPVAPEPETLVTLDDGQMISAVATLGVTLLMLAERHFPPHKLIHRKVKAVEASILDLYSSTGKHVDVETTEQFCACWDTTMKNLSVGGKHA